MDLSVKSFFFVDVQWFLFWFGGKEFTIGVKGNWLAYRQIEIGTWGRYWNLSNKQVYATKIFGHESKYNHCYDFIHVIYVLPCHPVGDCTQNSLHHSQMFSIIMRLEERYSQIQLEHYATRKVNGQQIRWNEMSNKFQLQLLWSLRWYVPNWPYITWLWPT